MRQGPPYLASPSSILLANVQSFGNKLDELHSHISSQWVLRYCCVFCFIETWLTSNILDRAIQPNCFSMHKLGRLCETTGKVKGGRVCFLVNNLWCTNVEVTCSLAMEHLTIKCGLFYLPREFPSVLLTAVYIPPQANATAALEELYSAISIYKNQHPHTLFHCGVRLQSLQQQISSTELFLAYQLPNQGQ